MSKWRKKGIELFPDLQKDIEDPRSTIYSLFFELLPRVRQAHIENNQSELTNIYGFAKWCFDQTSEDMWNSAGVGFYEHLGDYEVTRKEITKWVTPEMFDQLSVLFQNRMDGAEFEKLANYYTYQKRVVRA